jgi:predicted phosphodiesterase
VFLLRGFHYDGAIMRILATADLHYDIRRSQAPTEELAARVVQMGGDALVLVGDSAGRDPRPLRDCLRLFEGFTGRKLLVAGNHCLWCYPGEESWERYHTTLPQIVAEEGFEVLDHAPVQIGDVGLAGCVGWYDYSFRDESLEIPVPFYAAKVSPGAAARFEEHEALVAAHGERLTERHLSLGVRWMDGEYVRLGMTDVEFVEYLADRLNAQLDALSETSRQILTFIHHLPFAMSVPQGRPDRFAFAAAYMGAERLGQMLLQHETVSHVYCGHSHWRDRQRVDHLDVINIGSTYVEKHLEVLELPD